VISQQNIWITSIETVIFHASDILRYQSYREHTVLNKKRRTSEKRNYYLNESIACNWNSWELQRQINTLAFERILTQQLQRFKLNRFKMSCFYNY
jgi:hypothetical protein